MKLQPGMLWPPKPFDKAYASMREASAWWVGDPAGLTALYAGEAAHSARGEIDQTGVLLRFRNALRNMFWSRGQTNDSTTRKLHIPLPGDIVNASANVLFADPPLISVPKIDVPDGDADEDDDGQADDATDAPADEPKRPKTKSVPVLNEATCERIDALINSPGTQATWYAAAQSCSALGTVYLRVVYDDTVREQAWIDYVDADHAIPVFKWGILTEVTFWSELSIVDATTDSWRHFQRYYVDPITGHGMIEHSIYQGNQSNIGQQQPLTAHPDTEHLIDINDDDITSEGVIDTGLEGLPVEFVPNAVPNPAWRDWPQLRHLGRADLSSDLLPLFDTLDEVHTSWQRDIRLGRRRILVSEHLLDDAGAGKGASFDDGQEVFTKVSNPSADQPTIEAIDFSIRTEDHKVAAESIVREVLRKVGFSPLTFGLDANIKATTATEVSSHERTTDTTRTAKQRLWAPKLAAIAKKCVLVDIAQEFADPSVTIPDDVELDVEWPPSQRESEAEVAATVLALSQAGAASTRTLVKMQHADWDDGQIDDEVDLIESAKKAANTLPDFGGVGAESAGNPMATGPKIGAAAKAAQTGDPAMPKA